MGGDFLISSSIIKGRDKIKCDDSVYSVENELGYFIGLSDGAGSKANSHLGSKYVLEFAEIYIVEYLKRIKCNPKKINLDFKKEFIFDLQEALKACFLEELDNYAATLLFVQYIKEYDRYLIAHIGDGVIGGVIYDNELVVVSTPENGEFSNETFFYSDNEAFNHLRMYWVRGLRGIVMFSDGPEVVLYSKKEKKLANGVKNLFSWQKELKEGFDEILKDNLELFSQYTNDDCSIVISQNLIEDLLIISQILRDKHVRYKSFKR